MENQDETQEEVEEKVRNAYFEESFEWFPRR